MCTISFLLHSAYAYIVFFVFFFLYSLIFKFKTVYNTLRLHIKMWRTKYHFLLTEIFFWTFLLFPLNWNCFNDYRLMHVYVLPGCYRVGVFYVGGIRSAQRKPTCPSRRLQYPVTYNYCRSRDSNSVRSGDKRVQCPLCYLDTQKSKVNIGLFTPPPS